MQTSFIDEFIKFNNKISSSLSFLKTVKVLRVQQRRSNNDFVIKKIYIIINFLVHIAQITLRDNDNDS